MHDVSAFGWLYDAGLPFNCVNYSDNFSDFIEIYGPRMKSPAYHKARVPCLKKEAEKTNKIVEDHKVQWSSAMMDEEAKK